MPLPYSRGYEYQTEADYYIQTPLRGHQVDAHWYGLDRRGEFFLRRGYAWDGATCYPDFPTIIRPSALHDGLCQAMRNHELDHDLYKVVNQFFYEQCLASGMWKPHAKLVQMAINLARSGDPRRGPDRPVLYAP